MHFIEACPCCSGCNLKNHTAILSPFVAEYASIAFNGAIKLQECMNCQFCFYNPRFDPPEVKRLYSEYRGERYYKIRHRHEFWYTSAINNGLGRDKDEIDRRKKEVSIYLRKFIPTTEIASVLDYGGDEGQFLPDDIGTNRTVYDISGVRVRAGVKRVTIAQELKGQTYDLILLCHVLEHCTNPRSVLKETKSLLKKNGWIYIELPYDKFDCSTIAEGNFYNHYLSFVVRFPLLYSCIDFYSTLFKIKFNRIPPLGIIKMHEHINYFNIKSLSTMLEINGINVIDCRIDNHKTLLGRYLTCIAQVI